MNEEFNEWGIQTGDYKVWQWYQLISIIPSESYPDIRFIF